MFITEIGSWVLALLFCTCLLHILLGFLKIPMDQFYVIGKRLAYLQGVVCLFAFAILIAGYIASDYSIANVFNNSHHDKPLLYKIVGSWGNHEGSLLLWITILSAYFIGLYHDKILWQHPDIAQKSVIVQSLVTLSMVGFMIWTSSPFARLFPVPFTGKGLNPLLQDIGLAMHPPVLYAGYVGFSAVFSVACGCLWQSDLPQTIGNVLRRWCLVAWAFLTMGIGLGMWWAYYELGWGGFWFWDPVENASLMPWLTGTALLHSCIILEKRGIMKRWTLILAMASFACSTMGTFVVRSGIIASVHSFASSPTRGIFLLGLLALTLLGAMILYLKNYHALRDTKEYPLLSREGSLLLNNYLLGGMLLIVATGTFYPPFLQIIGGEQITVGTPYYQQTMSPLFYAVALLSPLAGFMAWGQNTMKRLIRPVLYITIMTIGAVLACYVFVPYLEISGWIFLVFALWMILGTCLDMGIRFYKHRYHIDAIVSQEIGKYLAHLGVGIAIFGMVGTVFLRTEQQLSVKIGESFTVAGERFTITDNKIFRQDNFITDQAVIQHENTSDLYVPERRFFKNEGMTTTEADIHLFWNKDIYLTIGAWDDVQKTRIVNVRVHPWVGCLWGGIIITALGGFLQWLLLQRKQKTMIA